MLAIRLQRIGKKGQPSYRLVVAERRSKLGAPPTEDLGSYDPFTKKANFKTERITHWITVGAEASVTVHNLLVREGVVNAPKRSVRVPKPAPKSEAPTSAEPAAGEPPSEAATADKPVEEAVPEAAAE